MNPSLNRALLVAGLVLFVIASLLAFQVFGSATIGDLFGLTDAGLACWIAAALV